MNRALIYNAQSYGLKILAENNKGIWYEEDGSKVAEFRDGQSYSCSSIEEFNMLSEMTD